jgi:CubicO group peptidase (beta-lactamase class C family)
VSSRRRFLVGLVPLGVTALRVSPTEPPVFPTHGFERAAATIRDAVARGDLPGAVLHVRVRGSVAYERAFGWKDIEGDRALTPDDIFPVASLTKPVVAAAMLKLSEVRAVHLDDAVSRYLPEFEKPRVLVNCDPKTGVMTTRPARREITIHDLLTHTAGIHHGFAEIDSVFGTIYEKAGVVHAPRIPLADNVKRLGPLPLVHDPGTRWTYGLSSEVLGRVVEVVTGVPLDLYVSRTIFEPLAMRRTYFFPPLAERDNVVSRYGVTNGTIRALAPDRLEEPRHVSGGGGLHTTAGDYGRFCQALLDGGRPILARSSIRAMTTNQIGNLSAFGFRWGFSLAVSTPDAPGRVALPVGGFGWYGIFGTWFWALPKHAAVVLMFANVLRPDMNLPLFARVADEAMRAVNDLSR